eukprot:s3785_g2.t1
MGAPNPKRLQQSEPHRLARILEQRNMPFQRMFAVGLAVHFPDVGLEVANGVSATATAAAREAVIVKARAGVDFSENF